jgi:hypothetical protein
VVRHLKYLAASPRLSSLIALSTTSSGTGGTGTQRYVSPWLPHHSFNCVCPDAGWLALNKVTLT